ncbi:MAG TPA: FkbM family methyltransferase [Planctomycetota bacterium]|nr:FkbM family methyltransferase [Planctomycetota bacterium]
MSSTETAGAPGAHDKPPWYWHLLVPYLRREWPAWGKLYALAGGRSAGRWRHAGRGRVRGKLHGYWMELDLSNWSERLSWCLGRYHDLPVQLVLQQVLRPGDCFVDVGANLGMLSLLAHRLVGPTGLVIACEPNPRLRGRIEAQVRDNGIERLQLVAKALGDADGTAELREFDGHSGWGSLSVAGPVGAVATASFHIPVVRGDDVLAAVPMQQPMVVKIDVEGHEVPALRGLRGTLAARLPLVLVEVAEAHQRRAGYSVRELREQLEGLGYRGFVLELRRRALLRRTLVWRALSADEAAEVDVLFVPPRGPLAGRTASLLAGAAR